MDTAGRDKATRKSLNFHYLSFVVYRLLQVLCRDRFSDFLGDTVIVPVRESCAQTLGVVSKLLDAEQVCGIYSTLLTMIQCATQHVREERNSYWSLHLAGLLGVKYVLAVRSDLASVLLPKSMDHVIDALTHSDDDIRAVAASTLLPSARFVVTHSSPAQRARLLGVLTQCLTTCDDLSASTSSAMDLLAEFTGHSEMADLLVPKAESTEHVVSLPDLVPSLCKFFRHPLSCVRFAIVRVFEALVGLEMNVSPRQETWWIRHEIIRHIFQNFLLEDEDGSKIPFEGGLLGASLKLWKGLIAYLAKQGAVAALFQPLYKAMIQLALTPAGRPMDASLILRPAPAEDKSKGISIDRAILQGDLGVIREADLIRGRLFACSALGLMFAYWRPESRPEEVHKELSEYFSSQWAFQKQMAALIVHEYANSTLYRCTEEDKEKRNELETMGLSRDFKDLLNELLIPGASDIQQYGEVAIARAKVYAECSSLAKQLRLPICGLDQFYVEMAGEYVRIHMFPSKLPSRFLGSWC
jgi:TATA-binding protein-associated factor